MPSRGIRGHNRGVHGPRCLPSHLLDCDSLTPCVTHRTLLTRVFRVNPRCRHALKDRFVRRIVLEHTERQVVQASVRSHAVVDTLADLFEVFKDDALILELTAPLHEVTVQLVESVTDEPFFSLVESIVHTRFSMFCTRFRIVK